MQPPTAGTGLFSLFVSTLNDSVDQALRAMLESR
jgi:hypothetical protein